ncbi:hypothetical protein [Pseudonocardia halophobica]|uniref:hypothetical protein n=1 Tax=Pseudonocardia halophobica TaxID=29401 RepID=UPI0012DC814F|nr:hypothetical protein [Pseudonocardia halophobica]
MRSTVEDAAEAGGDRPELPQLPQVQRRTVQPAARIASSRTFSAKTAAPASCPGASSRPHLTRPSNSPTTRCSRQAKSTRPSTPRATPGTTSCSTGGGRPAAAIAIRLGTPPALGALGDESS